jgi:hypothetical protein
MMQQALMADLARGFEVEMPLTADTDNAEHVAQLLGRVLNLIDEFCSRQNASDADVVQALSVATALRAAMAEVERRTGTEIPKRLIDIEVSD